MIGKSAYLCNPEFSKIGNKICSGLYKENGTFGVGFHSNLLLPND